MSAATTSSSCTVYETDSSSHTEPSSSHTEPVILDILSLDGPSLMVPRRPSRRVFRAIRVVRLQAKIDQMIRMVAAQEAILSAQRVEAKFASDKLEKHLQDQKAQAVRGLYEC